MPAFPIYFIRHGETDWNAEGRMQGQKDIPLNDHGRSQAGQAGRLLSELTPDPGALDWWVSPLGRTVETADLARRALGLPAGHYRTDTRLMEITFGKWEGMTWKEVRQFDPAGATRRDRDKWNTVAPAGESYEMLSLRVKAFLPLLTGPSVIVAHGGTARVLMHHLSGTAQRDAVNEDVWQGRILVFENGSRRWVPS